MAAKTIVERIYEMRHLRDRRVNYAAGILGGHVVQVAIDTGRRLLAFARKLFEPGRLNNEQRRRRIEAINEINKIRLKTKDSNAIGDPEDFLEMLIMGWALGLGVRLEGTRRIRRYVQRYLLASGLRMFSRTRLFHAIASVFRVATLLQYRAIQIAVSYAILSC